MHIFRQIVETFGQFFYLNIWSHLVHTGYQKGVNLDFGARLRSRFLLSLCFASGG